VIVAVFLGLLVIPGRVELDHVQLDEPRVRLLAVLGNLQEEALDLTGLVVDRALERSPRQGDTILIFRSSARSGRSPRPVLAATPPS
jgi:hypothetical protein